MSAEQDKIELVQATQKRSQEQVEVVLQELIQEEKIDLVSADKIRQAVPAKPKEREVEPETEPESEEESQEPEEPVSEPV